MKYRKKRRKKSLYQTEETGANETCIVFEYIFIVSKLIEV